MSRVGGTRSLSFGKPDAARVTPPATNQAKPELSKPSNNPLILYRALSADHGLIGTMLKHLGANPAELHGDLQVILSAVRRMSEHTQNLIEQEEEANA